MRIVLISKALVTSAYRAKCEALAVRPDVELMVIVPPSWRERGAWETTLEPAENAAYTLVCTRIVWNGHYHVHFYPRLGAVLRDWAPDILHVDEEPYNFATFQAMWLGRKLGARLAFTALKTIHRQLPPPFSLFEGACFAWSHHAFAGTDAADAVLRAKGFAKPIDVIPQFGVDANRFRPAFARPDGPFVIGYAGRLVEAKGVQVLLRAVVGLSGDWRLVVAGEGGYRHALEALARDLGIGERVQFLPPLPPKQMPDLLRLLEVLVLPSLTTPKWKEQFGRVLIEAMACRVPVVGSDSGEIPKVIAGAGIITPEGDAQALRSTLQMLNDDVSARARLAAAGRRRILENYASGAIASRYYAAYRRLLEDTRALPAVVSSQPAKRLRVIDLARRRHPE